MHICTQFRVCLSPFWLLNRFDATGNCTNQVTSCRAAYYSVNERPAPAKCSRKNKCAGLTGEMLESCLKKWANCVKRFFRDEYGKVCTHNFDEATPKHVQLATFSRGTLSTSCSKYG